AETDRKCELSSRARQVVAVLRGGSCVCLRACPRLAALGLGVHSRWRGSVGVRGGVSLIGACLGYVPVRSGSARIGFAAGGIGPTTGTVSISPSTSTVSISPSTSTVGIGVVVRFRSFVRGAADLDVVDLLGRGLGRDLTVGPGRHFVGRRPQRSVGDAHSREGRNVVVDALCLPFETRNMIVELRTRG